MVGGLCDLADIFHPRSPDIRRRGSNTGRSRDRRTYSSGCQRNIHAFSIFECISHLRAEMVCRAERRSHPLHCRFLVSWPKTSPQSDLTAMWCGIGSRPHILCTPFLRRWYTHLAPRSLRESRDAGMRRTRRSPLGPTPSTRRECRHPCRREICTVLAGTLAHRHSCRCCAEVVHAERRPDWRLPDSDTTPRIHRRSHCP